MSVYLQISEDITPTTSIKTVLNALGHHSHNDSFTIKLKGCMMMVYKVTFHFYQLPQSDKHTIEIQALSENSAYEQAKAKLEQDFPYESTQPYTVICTSSESNFN